MFYVYRGTPARLVYNDGRSIPYRTKRYLAFHIDERIQSRKGFLAFKRGDYTLIVESHLVKIKPTVIESIRDALYELAGYNELPDIDEIQDLSNRPGLTTRQTLLGAFFVQKYRKLLTAGLAEEASVLYSNNTDEDTEEDVGF